MAGNSKQRQLSLRVYNTLQSLGCPLVDGLYLREAESIQELLCSPSLHRTDILKWICASICPAIREKFSTIRTTQNEYLIQELTRFGHEMMLCKANDQDLIKGLAPPLRQLVFLEQLLIIVQSDSVPSRQNSSSGDESVKNEDLLGELMSQDHSSDLDLLLNPTCNPWSAHIREHLIRTQSAHSKTNGNHSKPNDFINRSDQHSRLGSHGEEDLTEAIALLQSTQSTLEEIRKECEFQQSHSSGSAAVLSPCALKVAITDMSQLMTAFSHVYNTDFKGYCQRASPSLCSSTSVFQSVHQLLRTCNMELEALKQLSETSKSLTQTVRQLQTERRYWSKGEKHTLPNQLEELKNKYAVFLSPYQS
ncbi:HAUS augmin-like complex subunit 7 [Xyrauchen texanus]|uniref:HAUS augmin-like complex subunit 7 n=1 Tax=Xyrauchen texanus TaxID=154827 RepID=UPI002241F55D|nr:HAUS augmin-like complex subunit 7 [Xyrauchen texanus]XP_051947764.1 HAUS augmin-like complex subunit 7 [Xyrauchen texanus]XP_051947765.1 HAUS augmin-like complex subunit 7 [Xyrauchen texanus]